MDDDDDVAEDERDPDSRRDQASLDKRIQRNDEFSDSEDEGTGQRRDRQSHKKRKVKSSASPVAAAAANGNNAEASTSASASNGVSGATLDAPVDNPLDGPIVQSGAPPVKLPETIPGVPEGEDVKMDDGPQLTTSAARATSGSS